MSNQNALGAPILTHPAQTFYVNPVLGIDDSISGRGSIGLPFATLTATNAYISSNSLNIEGSPVLIILQSGTYTEMTPSILPYCFIYAESNQSVILQNPIQLAASDWSTVTGNVIAGIKNLNSPSSTSINFSTLAAATFVKFYSYNNIFNDIAYIGQIPTIPLIVYECFNSAVNLTVDGLIYEGAYNKKTTFTVNTTFDTTYNVMGDNVSGSGNALIVDGGATLLSHINCCFLNDLTTTQTSGGLFLNIDAISYPLVGIVNTNATISNTTSSDAVNANFYFTPVNYVPGNGGANFALGSVTANLFGIDSALATTQQFQQFNYALDTGAVNAYIADLTPAISGLLDGMLVRFKVGTTNTGASTLTVNGFGPTAITTTTLTALTGSELFNGMMAELQYDGTEWQLLNPANTIVAPVDSNTATTGFGSVAIGTALQNTLGYDILVNISIAATVATGATIVMGVGSTNTPTTNPVTASFSVGLTASFSAIVPNGYYLLVNTTGTITVGSITTQVCSL